MPRDSLDSSRKKDKHSSRRDSLKDIGKVFGESDELSKRKHVGKYVTDDSKSSKKNGDTSDHISGRKRHFVERDNCFASEYDDFEGSKKLARNNSHAMQQHSRNGLVIPAIATRHSLVDYDEETSDSGSSSESLPQQYPTVKTARRKSCVQVVSASVKADLNDRQQSQQSDTTVSRHVRLSSSSSAKQLSIDSVNHGERTEKKKTVHKSTEAPEPAKVETKAKDIPAKSPKRRHSKDHRESRKYDDKQFKKELTTEQSQKADLVDKSEKPSALKTASKATDKKKAKRRDSETKLVVTIRAEKSKAHKKSKKHELPEEQLSENVDGTKQKRRTSVSKPYSTDTAVLKKEKSQKVLDDSIGHSKTEKQKKTPSHSESSTCETKRLQHGTSSMQQDELVLKHNSGDHGHSHKKHEKEKHGGKKKKSHVAEDSSSNNDKQKKDRSAVKDDITASRRKDKTKDKTNKDKVHHSRTEREFSDEGQISSDSSDGRTKESRHKHRLHASSRNEAGSPVRSFKSASASAKTAVISEVYYPDR